MAHRPARFYLQRSVALAVVTTAILITLRRAHIPHLFWAIQAVRLTALALMVWLMTSWYRTRDERERLHMLQVLALTGGLSLFEVLAMTFVVQGLARLNGPTIFLTALGNFMVSAFALEIRRDLLERGPRFALWKLSLFIPPLLAPWLWWLLTLMFPLPVMTFRTGYGIFLGAWLLVSVYLAFSKATEK